MKNRQDGFVTSDVILVLAAVCVLLFALHLFVSSSIAHTKTYKEYYIQKKEAEKLLEDIVSDMQELKFDDADFSDSVTIRKIETKYEENGLLIKDCSSGINERTFREDFLHNEKTVNFLSYKGEGVLREYGFINKRWSDEKTRKNVEEELKENARFLINTLPLVNIYMCDIDFLDLIAEHCGVKDYADKKNAFYELIFLKSFSREEASKRLGLSESSSFFDIFGVKTTFWKVSFFMKRFKVCAVVCAVPGENEKIAEYRVMELFVEEK